MSLGDDFKQKCHKQMQKEVSHNAKKKKEYELKRKKEVVSNEHS